MGLSQVTPFNVKYALTAAFSIFTVIKCSCTLCNIIFVETNVSDEKLVGDLENLSSTAATITATI